MWYPLGDRNLFDTKGGEKGINRDSSQAGSEEAEEASEACSRRGQNHNPQRIEGPEDLARPLTMIKRRSAPLERDHLVADVAQRLEMRG